MKQKSPSIDAGFAALLEDLAQRGLLESTIVLLDSASSAGPPSSNGTVSGRAVGTTGNTPTPVVVAGGGFRGGVVVGASDAKGETIKDRPIYPWDLTASIYKQLGIDYMGKLPHPQGCGVACLSPLAGGGVKSGGLLTEIM